MRPITLPLLSLCLFVAASAGAAGAPNLVVVPPSTTTKVEGTPSKPAKELTFTNNPNFFDANPGGQPLGPCHGGTVIDKKGNIYISTDTARGILVFDSKGKFIRNFGPSHLHAMVLRKEHGTEYIYGASPANHDVVKVALDGTILWTIRYPAESGLYTNASRFNPCAVAVGPDMSVYVVDGYGENYFIKYDKDGHFVKAVGGPGEAEGKFKTCHGIALDTRGKKPLLMIANRLNHRIEYWDLDCNFVRVIRDDLRLPSALNIHDDYVILADLAGRVTVLDKNNNIVAQVGDNPNTKQRGVYGVPPEDWTEGVCNAPHSAAMDKNGNLIVSEWSKYGHLHEFTLVK